MLQEQRGGARSFVRSLNILLKFARLYEFGHVKTMQQFETTWKELRNALDDSSGGGVLLGASGTQILLDGVPLGSAAGERSFAQLLTSSGIASIHFSPLLTQPQFARFVRAFPSGNAKPSSLAEQLKTALAGDTSIKVNEIRYVAEDSSVAGIKVAAQLTQKVLGAAGDKFKDFFEDPDKMLAMILAAGSMRSGGGGGRMGRPRRGPRGAGACVGGAAGGTPARRGAAGALGRGAGAERGGAGAVRVVERGRVLVGPEVGAAPAAEAGPAARAAVQGGVGMGRAGGLEPAAVVVRERALVVVAPGAAAPGAGGTGGGGGKEPGGGGEGT